jgi:hypothetical protein
LNIGASLEIQTSLIAFSMKTLGPKEMEGQRPKHEKQKQGGGVSMLLQKDPQAQQAASTNHAKLINRRLAALFWALFCGQYFLPCSQIYY